MPEELTYMTDAHVAVIRQLERHGLGLMYEVDFPPYRVDVYLPDYHAAVEVDGPRHEENADRRRDRALMEAYGLYVFRVPSADAEWPLEWVPALEAFLRYTGNTRDERWERYGARTPWL